MEFSVIRSSLYDVTVCCDVMAFSISRLRKTSRGFSPTTGMFRRLLKEGSDKQYSELTFSSRCECCARRRVANLEVSNSVLYRELK